MLTGSLRRATEVRGRDGRIGLEGRWRLSNGPCSAHQGRAQGDRYRLQRLAHGAIHFGILSTGVEVRLADAGHLRLQYQVDTDDAGATFHWTELHLGS